jgi:MoaA/NifB/PqqE/SkfB family radical SAM enzyme
LTPLSIYKPQSNEDIVRLELELTSTCNLQCPLCIRSLGIMDIPKNKYRSLDEVLNQLDSYPNLEFVTIAGAIAEPTSYPHLLEVVKYLKQRDIEISLYINGDTRTDIYYKQLGVLFRDAKGHVYFTICGSTQELHKRYRVNSDINRVLKRLDIIDKFSGGKGILTWIIFNYNEQDFEENYPKFKAKYNTEFFYTLPVTEHFQLSNTIRLPDRLNKIYNNSIDRNDFNNVTCPANKSNFVQISYDGEVNPCSLYRIYGESHCWECSNKNLTVLRNNKIFNVAEPETEDSETPMRIYYDSKKVGN